MKKIITIAGIAFLFVFLSAPSFVKARTEVGYAYIDGNIYTGVVTLYCDYYPVTRVSFDDGLLYGYVNNNRFSLSYIYQNSLWNIREAANELKALYIPTLTSPFTWSVDGETRSAFTTLEEFEDFLNPPPSNIWEYFYDMYEDIFGHRPISGSIYDFLMGLFNDDPGNILPDITFPTLTPTPSPTPQPTPIPVQTIFVPDGNGNTSIIYQYTDPTTGVITQSPYNPNIDVSVDVNCDCNNGSNYSPTDPMYYPFDGLTWASVDGDFSDSPAMTAGQSLDIIKAEVDSYDEPIKVVSNSFSALPFKWLSLVGLLGACLIVAGLIRTFLGG